jgi:hypothetical protein
MHSFPPCVRRERPPFGKSLVSGFSTAVALLIASADLPAMAQEDGKGSEGSPAASSAGSGGTSVEAAQRAAQRAAPKNGSGRGEPVASPAPSAFGLGLGGGGLLGEPRLMLGPGGGLPPASDRASNTSLGPLPEFPSDLKPIAPEPIAEFPGVEMRRRSRPDLLPDGPNPTEEAALALKNRIRFRSLKARVMAEAQVSAALQASKKASTDREMRLALKRHYELLFARMREIEPSLESLIMERETEAQEALRESLPR